MATTKNFSPTLVGSMSQGAAGNPTVAMVEAAFAHHDLCWRYVNMEIAPDDLATAVKGAHAMGYQGFNLSMPHKVSVIPLLAGLGESAAVIGAVNCVVRRDGQFIGENTDGKGFLASLEEVIDPHGQHVVLFGAGGAARAVAVELALAGASKITLVNRTADRGEELASTLREKTGIEVEFVLWQGEFAVPEGASIVINATSIGLYDAQAQLGLDFATLDDRHVVADVVFNPPQTHLLREAAARGCRVIDGLSMLVNQGVIGVEHWTGVTPDAAVMRAALERALDLGWGNTGHHAPAQES
jgi:shikimate dehydrogenase